MAEIEKIYNPSQTEPKWYRFWLENNLFHTDPHSGLTPYCIMMPPPNVTGELHMGHALQDSLQDMLIRMKRMQGFEALWQPGMDHAGIATQNVVEKALAKEGLTRHELGRERFLERVWQWKERYGNRIFEQKRLLGDSADWSRERFTLDAGLSRAVAKVFVHLYEKGLIYRGWYIVNWCPRCRTALSDEEVNHEEHQGHLWYFKYPLTDSDDYVTVATTRPETMLGDSAVAVNPEDERFQTLIGRRVRLPLAGRIIPIVADPFVDPKFGTGQVKVTPAHDPNDFAIAERQNLEKLVVMDETGRMNENVPAEFRRMDRFQAREAVVKALEAQGLVAKIEDYTTSIGHCQRCRSIIEPYLSRQWFVRMKPLAEPALEAVRSGRIRFYPARWEKVYYGWMENIRDWCISRQLWWGHRIPVWYCDACGETVVREAEPENCPHCAAPNLRQDEDVLDTWFSSWLWPFSTLGWPDETTELKFWYPTDVLVSGYDIIFFWIARMIMAGLEFVGDIPFRDVFITGMIKDEQGRWMSKSLGNGIDPAEMVARYGADAVRFTLISLAAEGQDIKLAPSRFEGGRNFANKLWNSYRFLMANRAKIGPERPSKGGEAFSNLLYLPDRWIVSRLRQAVEAALDNADKYRLNDIALGLYDFIWKEYCDWYLEMVKVRLADDQPTDVRRHALDVALGVFEAALKMLHPIMPYITEEMWQGVADENETGDEGGTKDKSGGLSGAVDSIMRQPYPAPTNFPVDPEAERDMDFIQRLVTAVRTIRAEMGVPPERKASLTVNGCDAAHVKLIADNQTDIFRLAGLSELHFNAPRPPQSASAVVDAAELFVPLAGLIDFEIERNRLNREWSRLNNVIRGAEGKLNNEQFIAKAPAEVVEAERRKLADCRAQLAAVQRSLETLNL